MRLHLPPFGRERQAPVGVPAADETRHSPAQSPSDPRLSALPHRVLADLDKGSSESMLRKRIAVLTASEARFMSLTSLGSDWCWDQDANFRFTAISGDPGDSIGLAIKQHLGCAPWELPQIEPPEGGWDALRGCLGAHETFQDVILRGSRGDGGVSFVSFSGEPVFDENRTFVGYRGIGLDVTKQKLIEAATSRLARFDPLTRLYNRTAFLERLNHAIAVARRHDRSLALLFVDLDRFKDVNDAYGHDSGDEVLKLMARRLTKTIRDTDTVGRLGGDEFIVLGEDVTNQVDVNEFGLRLLEALSEPFVLHGQECRLGASIGVGMFPNDGEDAAALLKNADVAMYRGKESGGNSIAFFSEVGARPATERMVLGAGLRRAIDGNQLVLLYQPKVSIQSGALTGVEALVRWQHPERGLMLPDTFIPLAEDSGLIRQIGRWVLHQACAQACRWRADGPWSNSCRSQPVSPPVHRW